MKGWEMKKAAASGASRAAPSKHFYSRLRKAKNGKVEADELAGKCDATSGKQKRLLSHESFVSVGSVKWRIIVLNAKHGKDKSF